MFTRQGCMPEGDANVANASALAQALAELPNLAARFATAAA
jgi:hypothetical protein